MSHGAPEGAWREEPLAEVREPSIGMSTAGAGEGAMQTREQTEARRKRTNREAPDAFLTGKLEIDAMLQRLTEFSAIHFGDAQRQHELSDSAIQEGEHAS